MGYDKELVAAKLRRWEKYLYDYRLPEWEEIPDFGLYMEQVTSLMQDYLDYLPPELKEEQFITASTINNYVRTKVMPGPRKRRYYRVHLAYLIIILTLKQSMSIALIQHVIPMGLSDEEVERLYTSFVHQHRVATRYFLEQVREAAGRLLDHQDLSDFSVDSTEELIVLYSIMGGLSRVMAEKLLLLEGKDMTTGGSVELKRK